MRDILVVICMIDLCRSKKVRHCWSHKIFPCIEVQHLPSVRGGTQNLAVFVFGDKLYSSRFVDDLGFFP